VGKFEAVAQSYMSLGRDNLVLGDLFGIKGTPYTMAYKYLGLSRLLKGLIEEKSDPGKAVEYYAEAMGYFSNAMLEEYKSYSDQRIKKLSTVAKCWFCGRDVQGEEIHYVYMETLLTPYLQSKFGGESPPSMRGTKIVACVACYEAIHLMADSVARMYYERAMAALREVEQRLTQQIYDLQRRMATLEGIVRGLEGFAQRYPRIR